jgi:hypothetical protein
MEVTAMAGVRYEVRVSGKVSDRVRHAFDDMTVEPVPPESIIYGEVANEARLRDLLTLCSALGLQVVSLQQLPSGRGPGTPEG